MIAAGFVFAHTAIAAEYPENFTVSISQDTHTVTLYGADEDAGVNTQITLPEKAQHIQATTLKKDGTTYVPLVYKWKRKLRLQVYHPDATKVESRVVVTRAKKQRFAHTRLRKITKDDTTYVQVHVIKRTNKKQHKKITRKRYLIRPQKDTVIKLSQSKTRKIRIPATTGDDETDTLRRLNYYRKSAGLIPVVEDKTLSEGCALHVNYMVQNNLMTHYEEEGKPGYTEKGADAGVKSNIARGTYSLESALELWVNSLYHRLPIMEPSLTKVGFYYEKAGGFSCLHVSTVDGTEYRLDYPPVLFPAKGMTEVEPQFNAGENPDPLTDQGGTYPAGQVLTLSFARGDSVSAMNVKLSDEDGNVLEGYTRLPQDETDPNRTVQRNSVSFIPKKSLDHFTKFRVHATGTVNGKDFSKRWFFTTGE